MSDELKVAIKVLNPIEVGYKSVYREVSILRQLGSKEGSQFFIPKIEEVVELDIPKKGRRIAIVMEHKGIPLHKFL